MINPINQLIIAALNNAIENTMIQLIRADIAKELRIEIENDVAVVSIYQDQELFSGHFDSVSSVIDHFSNNPINKNTKVIITIN